MSQFFTTETAPAGHLQLITVKSNALGHRADLSVHCPAPAWLSPGMPLVILLHGVYGSHWAWSAKGGAPDTLETLMADDIIRPMILAMPSDGLYGDGSGYVPHQKANYEKWIVEDVVQVMKEQFPVLTADSPVFIVGLSMGGYGALRLGAKYPQVFRAFSGMSSITEFGQMAQFVSNYPQLQADALEQDRVIDCILKNQGNLPPFRFDCGVDDPLIAHNRELHIALQSAGIPHSYEEYPGGHSWEYWERHLGRSLVWFEGCC
jgi:S-formylglutathione hydrolase FrmB